MTFEHKRQFGNLLENNVDYISIVGRKKLVDNTDVQKNLHNSCTAKNDLMSSFCRKRAPELNINWHVSSVAVCFAVINRQFLVCHF